MKSRILLLHVLALVVLVDSALWLCSAEPSSSSQEATRRGRRVAVARENEKSARGLEGKKEKSDKKHNSTRGANGKKKSNKSASSKDKGKKKAVTSVDRDSRDGAKPREAVPAKPTSKPSPPHAKPSAHKPTTATPSVEGTPFPTELDENAGLDP